MSNDSAKTVFLNALEIASSEARGAYLLAQCGNDQSLRAEVEELLQHHEQIAAIGESISVSSTTFPPSLEHPGTQIGPYKLLQQIGEGGMGVVYMAEQTQPVQRRVALKVIKAGMDSRQVIARFEAERQALAVMDHVNIARVLDAGATEHGRPYFVMELVHGVPITQYCDNQRLTPRQRLELFVPVCQAIQHAHQKGIIHRDIKPSNVMVTLYDGQPVPKVIDFGVAKATEQRLTERTLFTQYGTMVGTLEYMSPEQAEMSALGVDTRSDIYSLGVLLYELLTGSTPLTQQRMKDAAYAEILRMIKEEEPPKPSTRLSDLGEALASISAQRHTEPAKLTKLVRGELDWIVMKCLEKDRNRRYETASGFAMDVQRYLADEPVLACPPSAMYRFRKFARRNKAALATAAVVGLAILLAVGSFGWMARDQQLRHARLNHEAELALKEAGQARERALTLTDDPYQWDAALAAAGSAVKSAAGIAAQDDAALTPDLQRQLRSLQAGLEADVRDRQFAARFDEIRLEPSENPVWRNFKFTNAYPAIGKALDDFYDLRIGTTPADEAKHAVLERPLPIQRYLLAALEVALMYAPPGDTAAVAWLKNVLAAVDTNPWRQRARQAVEAEDWQSLENIVSEPAAARQPAADLLRYADRAPVKSASKLAMLRLIRRTYPADFWANHQLASTLHACQPPQLDEAIRYYTAAVALRPKSTAAAANLATALRNWGRNEQALAAFQELLRLDPDNALAYVGMGWTLSNQNRLDEALEAMHQAIRLRPAMPTGYDGLSSVLMKQKKFAEAVAASREAVQLGPKDPYCHNGLGFCLLRHGLPAEAEREQREAIRLNPRVAKFQVELGQALEAQQKFEDAEQAYREAI
jgi:serine/threonine protein kinase/Flp pilus assembly protein TadD